MRGFQFRFQCDFQSEPPHAGREAPSSDRLLPLSPRQPLEPRRNPLVQHLVSREHHHFPIRGLQHVYYLFLQQ